MAIRNRVRRLEMAQGGRECPACGWPLVGFPKDVKVEVTWEEDDPEPSGPEYCPECGRQLVFTVTWPDEKWPD